MDSINTITSLSSKQVKAKAIDFFNQKGYSIESQSENSITFYTSDSRISNIILTLFLTMILTIVGSLFAGICGIIFLCIGILIIAKELVSPSKIKYTITFVEEDGKTKVYSNFKGVGEEFLKQLPKSKDIPLKKK